MSKFKKSIDDLYASFFALILQKNMHIAKANADLLKLLGYSFSSGLEWLPQEDNTINITDKDGKVVGTIKLTNNLENVHNLEEALKRNLVNVNIHTPFEQIYLKDQEGEPVKHDAAIVIDNKLKGDKTTIYAEENFLLIIVRNGLSTYKFNIKKGYKDYVYIYVGNEIVTKLSEEKIGDSILSEIFEHVLFGFHFDNKLWYSSTDLPPKSWDETLIWDRKHIFKSSKKGGYRGFVRDKDSSYRYKFIETFADEGKESEIYIKGYDNIPSNFDEIFENDSNVPKSITEFKQKFSNDDLLQKLITTYVPDDLFVRLFSSKDEKVKEKVETGEN